MTISKNCCCIVKNFSFFFLRTIVIVFAIARREKYYPFVPFTFQVSNSPIIQGLNPFACFVLGIIIPFHDPVVVAQG